MSERVTLDHPIFTRWPAKYADRLQLFSAPTPNGVKVGIMLEETRLAYEPHRIDIMADESHDSAFLALNPNGKIPTIYDPDGPSGVLFNVRDGRSPSFKNCGACYFAPPDDLTSGKSIGVRATWLR